MNKLKPLIWCCASLSWLAVPSTQAAQSVKSTGSIIFADSQAIIPVNLSYSVTAPDTENAAGLGLRVHYNSKALDLMSQTPYASQLQPSGALMDDSQNLDADTATDKYWVLAWVDLNATWPGTGKTPLSLLSSSFKTKAGFTGFSAIRFSASTTAKNTSFQTSPLVICAKPNVSLTTIDAIANEKDANTASFQVSLAAPLPVDCGSVAINYQVGGSALAGSDYTALTGQVLIPAGNQQANILVTPLADSQTELEESVTLTLQASSYYQLTSTVQASASLQDASTNTLPSIILTSAKLQVLEGADTSLALTLVRQGNDISKDLTVYLQATGSASVGSDYQALANSVVIPAGQIKTTLTVSLLNDAQQEQTETLKISLQTNATYQLSDLNSVDLALLDDESRSNTDLALNPVKPASIPSLSTQMLLFLSSCLALLAVTQPRLRQRLKRGLKAC